MAQEIINNGTFDNDPSAEKIRTAFDKTNSNFTELYNDKLNKVSTAGVERAYIINPDGSQGVKNTSDFGGSIFPNVFQNYPNYIIIQEGGGGLSYVGSLAFNVLGTQAATIFGGGGFSYRKFTSAATAGSSTMFNESSFLRVLSTAGFYFRTRIKSDDATTISDVRFSYGFAGTAGIFNNNPSSATQTLLSFAADNTDTNCQIMYKTTAGGTTKIDLGASFPKDSTSEYVVEFWRDKNTTTIFYKITNITTGAVTSGNFIFAINAITPCIWRNNSATASTCSFALRRLELYLQD